MPGLVGHQAHGRIKIIKIKRAVDHREQQLSASQDFRIVFLSQPRRNPPNVDAKSPQRSQTRKAAGLLTGRFADNLRGGRILGRTENGER